LLHGHSFIEQVSLAQVRQDEIQEMDMTDTYSWPGSGQMLEHELEVLADAQFRFWWIVKDVERNLVAQAFATQEGVRGDGR
jgi:hypothetical protein